MSKPIEIYVDADACPVKAEVYRVAARYALKVHVVTNSFMQVPQDPLIARVTFRNWDFPQRRQLFSGVRLASDA